MLQLVAACCSMLQCVALAKRSPRPHSLRHYAQMSRLLLGTFAANSLHDGAMRRVRHLQSSLEFRGCRNLTRNFSLGGLVIFVPCFLKCSLLFLKDTLFPAGIGISRSPMGKLNFVEFVIIQIHPKTLFEIWLNA